MSVEEMKGRGMLDVFVVFGKVGREELGGRGLARWPRKWVLGAYVILLGRGWVEETRFWKTTTTGMEKKHRCVHFRRSSETSRICG